MWLLRTSLAATTFWGLNHKDYDEFRNSWLKDCCQIKTCELVSVLKWVWGVMIRYRNVSLAHQYADARPR